MSCASERSESPFLQRRTATPPFSCAGTFIKLGSKGTQRVVDTTCANNAGGGRGDKAWNARDEGDRIDDDC